MENLILNSKVGDVELKGLEVANFRNTEQLLNSTGYEIDITTLTAISKRVVEQKFYTVAPAQYMPVKVGENSFASEILTYRDFSIGGDFESGNINTGASNSRLSEADSAVDSITVPIIGWVKQIGWTIFDLQLASKSGNWDLVSSKEKARKKIWDLGIQKIAFVGSTSDSNVKGLLTQDDVTANTTTITKYIKDMSATEFNTFAQTIIGDYRSNANYTAMPTHFIIPELDYTGLASFPDATYPLKTKLDLLKEAFRAITQNPNFEIKPLSYADQVNNADVSGLNKNVYTLLNYDEDSVNMNIPLNYTNTVANTVNGFQFQNAAYGRYSGCKAYRPKEMLYFTFAA